MTTDGTAAPAYTDCEHGLSAELCMGPNHYPSIEWDMEHEHFADDVSERYAGEAIPADYFDDEPWAWDEETGEALPDPDPALVPAPFVPRDPDEDDGIPF